MEVVFLGISDAGMEIYEWLCNRDEVDVLAMLTTSSQLEQIETLAPELVVSVGFDHIVPPDVIAVPDRGCINLHGGYLPYNRRRNSNVWPIVDDTPAGVTLHFMNKRFDEGDIIAQNKVPVNFDDTAKDLYHRLEQESYELFVDTWPDIERGEISTEPQGDGGTTHTRKDFEYLCRIDPDETYRAKELLDILRATTFPPFNNAYTVVDGDKYYADVDIRDADSSDEASVGMVEEY